MIEEYEPATESLLDGDFSCETTEDYETETNTQKDKATSLQ